MGYVYKTINVRGSIHEFALNKWKPFTAHLNVKTPVYRFLFRHSTEHFCGRLICFTYIQKKKKKLRLGGDTNPASSDSSQCTPSVPEPSLDECGRDTASAKPSVYPPENYRKKVSFSLTLLWFPVSLDQRPHKYMRYHWKHKWIDWLSGGNGWNHLLRLPLERREQLKASSVDVF